MSLSNPKLIAEVGCNHKGNMEIARELIMNAALFCKADVVKFQKRCNKELLSDKQYKSPHPNPMHSYGKTYGEHREFLEFDIDEHKQLYDWCKEFKIDYSTSVWDTTSAKEIISLEPNLIKIPSACNLHWKMLEYVCENYNGEIHLSLGMTTKEEEDKIVSFFKERKRNLDLVLYACTSGYPVAFEDICLLEINRLKDKFDDQIKYIGFSGHHLGIAADIAAITIGANWIERHFTLDRTWKGTDHSASLEPNGMRKLARDIKNVNKALSLKKSDLLPIEQIQRDKLKFNN